MSTENSKQTLENIISTILKEAGVNINTVRVGDIDDQGNIVANITIVAPETTISITEEKKQPDKDDNVLKGDIEIILVGFNNNEPIVAKVDTGATICSLHADKIKVITDPLNQEDVVGFSHGGKFYKMKLETHQAVQTADGGTGYRPVVKFTVKYKDKTYEDVLFNLNDRSEMPNKVLLGKNFLEKGNFLVDPTS